MASVPFAIGGTKPASLTASTPAGPFTLAGSREPGEGDAEGPVGPHTNPYPEEPCPSCGYDMTMITVTASFLLDDCEDVNYRCEKCCTQLHRQVRSRSANRDLAAALARVRART